MRKRWRGRKRTRLESAVSLVRESNPRPLVYENNHWANEATVNGVILPKLSDISPCILGVRKLWSDGKRIPMESSASFVRELNPRSLVYETSDLTTELTWQQWTVSFYQNRPAISPCILDVQKVTRTKGRELESSVSLVRDLNPRPLVYKKSALTTKLTRQWSTFFSNKTLRYSFTFSMCEKGDEAEKERDWNLLSASCGSRTLDPWFTRPVL